MQQQSPHHGRGHYHIRASWFWTRECPVVSAYIGQRHWE